jgi:hypothetical protein
MQDVLSMVQRKTASTTNVSEDVQKLVNEDGPNTKKRRHDTDTEDAPSKKARQQHEALDDHETLNDVPGKKVQSQLLL